MPRSGVLLPRGWFSPLVGLLLLLCACGGAQPPSAGESVTVVPSRAPAPAPTPNPDWLVADPPARSVQVTLIASYDATYAGFNFDGYGKGRLIFSVPEGWQVTVRCLNHGTLPHSCSLVQGALSGTVVFPGATSPDPAAGLPPGTSATFTFVAARSGVFRFASLVPGQEEAGMWDVLQVTAGGRPALFLS